MLGEPALAPAAAAPRVERRTLDVGLVSLITLAAALRLATLGVQSYWDDEATTVSLLRMPFGHMLHELPSYESTPPVYYVVAWAWAHVFGDHEAALRALSALAGIATVYFAYSAALQLAGRRAARVTGLLIACNPLLWWYSQEARAYALATMWCTAGFAAWIAVRRRSQRRDLVAWTSFSVAALATHYFSVFVVAPEALFLLWSARHARERIQKRRVLASVGVVALVGAALLPLALVQRQRGYAFHSISLVTRVAQVPEQILVGYGIWFTWWGKAAALGAAAAVAVALFALLRRLRRERSLRAPAALAVAGFVAPVALAVVGLDYILALYFLVAVPPLLVMCGVAFASTRRLPVLAAAVAAVGLAMTVVVAANPTFQREDLRGAANAVGTSTDARVLIVTPPSGLGAYLPNLTRLRTPLRLRELVVVGLPQKDPGKPPTTPRDLARPLAYRSFTLVRRVDGRRYTVLDFKAPHPVRVVPLRLIESHIGNWPARQVRILVQRPA